MKWLVKVAAFKLLSALPGGASLYRLSQKQFTKSVVPTRNRVDQKINVGLQYFKWLADRGMEQLLLEGVHLDFGSGWQPSIPLLYYGLGCRRQYLFDLAPVLDESLVRKTVETFLTIVSDPLWIGRDKLKRLPPRFTGRDWRHYLDDLGISYHAPYAQVFRELAGGLDVVTCTQVLYLVPREPMQWFIPEIQRSLKPGGVFLATIHLRDLFSEGRPGHSKYNQLRYSAKTWDRWINSRLMHLNRFRASDYRRLLESAGFQIIHFEVDAGTPEDFQELEKIPIADCFKGYSREDLAAKHLFVVAQKR